MKKVLIPIDGSPSSVKAAEQAVELAKKCGGDIIFLTVVEVKSDIAYADLGVMVTGEYYDIRDTLIKNKMEHDGKVLDSIVSALDTSGLKTDKRVVFGEAHPKIVETAEKNECDLIVMGHRGLNTFQRFFLGSVAKRVIEDAPCSVMIVK